MPACFPLHMSYSSRGYRKKDKREKGYGENGRKERIKAPDDNAALIVVHTAYVGSYDYRHNCVDAVNETGNADGGADRPFRSG